MPFTLIAKVFPRFLLQDSEVEVGARQDGSHQPYETTGQRDGPSWPSQSSPHRPQQAQASFQSHSAEEESRGVQSQDAQEHDDAAEGVPKWPAVVVNEKAQHERGPQDQHQIGQGKVQDIDTETAGSACLLITASTHHMTMTPKSERPNHEPIQRRAHLEVPRQPGCS